MFMKEPHTALLVATTGVGKTHLGTGHKVQRGGGGWAGKICLSGDGFLLTAPKKGMKKPVAHPITSCIIRTDPPL